MTRPMRCSAKNEGEMADNLHADTPHGRPFAGTASSATAHHDNVGRLAARYRALERTTQAENAWTKRGE